MHLRDSLSNPQTPLFALVKALEVGAGSPEQAMAGARQALVAQTGASDPARVRLTVKENRKLSSQEVAELVEAYQAGTSQAELARRFGMHEQTVRAHLKRGGVRLRPVRVLDGLLADEAIRLYVDEQLSLAKVGKQLGVSADAVRRLLMQRGVERRKPI